VALDPEFDVDGLSAYLSSVRFHKIGRQKRIFVWPASGSAVNFSFEAFYYRDTLQY
jgi:hypothetical protein